MAATPLSSITYWNHLVRYAHEQNIDIDCVTSRMESKENRDFVPFKDFVTLAAHIRESSGIPWVGLHIAQSILVSSHGSLGFAVSQSRDLKECLELISRYYQTRIQAMSIKGYWEGDIYSVSVNPECDWQPVTLAIYEVIMLSLLNVVEYALGKDIQKCSVHFPYSEPDWASKYHELLPCTVFFGGDSATIKVPRSLLSVTSISSSPRSLDLAKNQCDQELNRLSHYETLTEQLIYLIENNQGLDLSIDAVAKHLNTSKSTLIRKLKLENTSFKTVVEQQKKQQAISLLLNTELTVEAIAYKLGYEDNSNFGRVFKRWFGCSPANYRQRNKDTR